LKWRTHKLITRTVCKALSVPNAEDVADASILPDQHNEFFELPNGKHVRIKHHSPLALKAAWKRLVAARKLLLAGKDYSEELGMALHYIQDYSVDITKKFLIFRWRSVKVHDEREAALVKLPVPEDAIEEGLKIRNPIALKKALFSEKPEMELEKIMYTATMLSAAAVATVICPERSGYNWKKAVVLHTAAVAAPFLLVLVAKWFLPVAPGLGYTIHKLDFHYHRAKLEKEWFD